MSIILTIIVLVFCPLTSSDYTDTLCVSEHYHSFIDGEYVHQFYSATLNGDVYYCSSCGAYIYPVYVQLDTDPSEVYHWVIGSTLYSTEVYSVCTLYSVSGSQSYMYGQLTDDCKYEWQTFRDDSWSLDYIYIDSCPWPEDTDADANTDNDKVTNTDTDTDTSSENSIATYETGSDSSTGIIVGIVVAAVFVVVIGIAGFLMCRKRDKKEPKSGKGAPVVITQTEHVQMIPSEQRPPQIVYVQQPIMAAPPPFKYETVPNHAPTQNNYATEPPAVSRPPAYNEAYAEGGMNATNDKYFKIKQWFKFKVNLPADNDHYFNILVQNGYDSLDIIKLITDKELIQMGFDKVGHRRRMLTAISQIQYQVNI